MSRKSKLSSKKGVSNGPPPSYPSENYKEHRKFLIRSLERNDVDVSALIKLNKSLHKAKEKIIQVCGELVLLDLGSGHLKLINDGLHEEMETTDTVKETRKSHRHHLTPFQKEVCVDFLLRMKLRRKLSNRLIRRINRVARAMDGQDISPPSPPKYGDLGLHIDPKSIESRTVEWKEQEEAKKRIQNALNGYNSYSSKIDGGTLLSRTNFTKTGEKGATTIVESIEKEAEEKLINDKHDRWDKGKSEKLKGRKVQDEALTEKSKTSTKGSTPQPLGNKDKVDSDGIRKAVVSSVTDKKPVEIKADIVLKTTKTNSLSPTFAGDIQLLKEYETAYEKCWDDSTNRFKYVLGKDNVDDPEYTQIKQCGIGASSIILTLEDRKSEHVRWEKNMLAKIPEQPTYKELGLKNRVFDLEARKKRCLEDNIEGNDDEEDDTNIPVQSVAKKTKCDEGMTQRNRSIEKNGGKEQRRNDKDDDDGNNINMGTSIESEEDQKFKVSGSKDGNECKNKNIEDSVSGSDNNNDYERIIGNGGNNNDVKMKKEKKGAVESPVKPERSISFVAIPSFHDQDLARIRMIHKDLVNTYRLELIRKHFSDATNDYNEVQLLSTGLHDARQVAQRNLTITIARGRQELTRAHSNYTIAYTTAKQRWMSDKCDFDSKKCNAVLPTKWGSRPYGTVKTKKFISDAGSNIVKTTVGETLSDIVDGSILAANGKASLQRFKDFMPPPAPGMDAQTGENMAQRQHRIEMELRNQCSAIDIKFQKSEIERTRAWRKMMKTQAELHNLPPKNGGGNGRGGFRRMPVHQITLPSLRTSTQHSIPRELMQQVVPVAYTPSEPLIVASDSKYSAARIKERKAADGTVAPVSEPKKTKAGLYLRPAGRTRKGMQWDAINGVWVPQQT